MARFYEGIGFRLFASLLTISLILLAAGGLAFYNQTETMLEEQILASLDNTATLQKIRVNDAITAEIKEIEAFTRHPLLLTYIKSYLGGDDTALANITKSITDASDAPHFENIYLLNNDGNIFLEAAKGSYPTEEEQDSIYTRGSEAPSLFVHDFGDGAHVYICAPMTYNGDRLGVAVFKKNTDTLTYITEVTCVSHASEETILAYRGSSGEAIFFSKLKFANSTITVTPRNLNVPMIQALAGEETLLLDNPDYRGVRVLAATRYIETADIGLVTKIDLTEADAPIYEVRTRLLLIGSITIIVILAFSLYFANSISRPIRRLKEEVERVGSGELYVSEIQPTGDEIGTLGSSFKEMVEHLRFSFKQIEEKNEQLDNLNKELEAFSYSVSHDLRAPLRSIDGFSKIILEDYDDNLDDTGRDYLKRIRAATQRMGQLIDDLLALSRIHQMKMNSQTIDLTEVAQSIADELVWEAPQRRVNWRIQPAMTTTGDEALLKIALTNLLANSWKFTSKKNEATIEVGSKIVSGERVFFVRDDGAGFDMRYAHKLFTPFQRLHQTEDFPGTGIGLAIVQRIIVRHGGRIWVEAEEDKGATIFFTIKL